MERLILILKESVVYLLAMALVLTGGYIKQTLHWTELLSLVLIATAGVLLAANERVNMILSEFEEEEEDNESLNDMLDGFHKDNVTLRDGNK